MQTDNMCKGESRVKWWVRGRNIKRKEQLESEWQRDFDNGIYHTHLFPAPTVCGPEQIILCGQPATFFRTFQLFLNPTEAWDELPIKYKLSPNNPCRNICNALTHWLYRPLSWHFHFVSNKTDGSTVIKIPFSRCHMYCKPVIVCCGVTCLKTGSQCLMIWKK